MTEAASTTVAVLYPGELGARLGEVLRARGMAVITTLGGRSPRTARRCEQGGILVRPALADVVREADVVLSVVPPAAAEETARQYASLAHLAPRHALYVDLNSVGPELAEALACRMAAAGRDFVDASIHGQARYLDRGAVLYLSGGRAGDVARLFGDAVRVRVLGPEPGRASGMKMLLGGLSKGLCSLFAEVAVLAQRREMLGELLEEGGSFYPGVTEAVERMLPTYPQHAGRRAGEVRELEATVRAAGLEPCVLAAVRQLIDRMASVPSDQPPEGGWTLRTLVEHLGRQGFLQTGEAR